jgi:hypothetical protein
MNEEKELKATFFYQFQILFNYEDGKFWDERDGLKFPGIHYLNLN